MRTSTEYLHIGGTRWRNREARRLHYNRRMKEWRRENAEWSELQRRCTKRGITIDQYHAKAEAQDFLCAICGNEAKTLVIDHDHETGQFRGLLCGNCNTGIGLFKESVPRLHSAERYIAKYSQVRA